MNTLNRYLSTKTKWNSKYTPLPKEITKDNFLEWLKTNKFKEYDYREFFGTKKFDKLQEMNYPIYYCGPNVNTPMTNWIAIHTENLFDFVLWFSYDGKKVIDSEIKETYDGINTSRDQLEIDKITSTLNNILAY